MSNNQNLTIGSKIALSSIDRQQKISNERLQHIFSHLSYVNRRDPGSQQGGGGMTISFNTNRILSTINPDLGDVYLFPHSNFSTVYRYNQSFLDLIGELGLVYGNKETYHYGLEIVSQNDSDEHHLYIKYQSIIGGRFLAKIPHETILAFAGELSQQIGKGLKGTLSDGSRKISSLLNEIVGVFDEGATVSGDVDRSVSNIDNEPSAYVDGSIARIIPALKGIEYVDDECKTVIIRDQLDAKDYATIKRIFEDIGGRWHRASGTHIFNESPMDHIEQIIESGRYKKKYNLGYFPTQPDLTRSVIEDAGIQEFPGMRLLEPEMGQGHIADIVREMLPSAEISGYELNPENYAVAIKKHHCILADFLEQTPDASYDVVVMNPPFERQQDIKHVEHAMGFLKPGGKMVAIMSSGVTFRNDKRSVAFREMVNENGGRIQENAVDAFKKSGTMVKTVTVIMSKPRTPSLRM